jgi:hypothetical protein
VAVSASFRRPNLGRLPDRIYLSQLRRPLQSDRPPTNVRVIEYSVVSDGQVSELFCVITNRLEPDRLGTDQAPGLYARRWKPRPDWGRSRPTSAAPAWCRSKHPDGVE